MSKQNELGKINKKPFVIGITGHQGVGKSTALSFLADLGAFTINADKIVHELYGAKAVPIIRREFGNEFIENSIVDRRKMKSYLENNPQKIETLNKLIHPLVFTEIVEEISKSHANLIAIEAVYFKRGELLDLVDKLILIKRGPHKNGVFGLYLEAFYSRMQNYFNEVIENTGSLDDLYSKLVEIFKDLQYKAQVK